MAIGAHHSSRALTVEWGTPPEILAVVSPFDDDPASGDGLGLIRAWSGFVFLNPPYGSDVALWIRRLADHGDGIALTFARTDTRWFQKQVFDRADAILFIAGRLTFVPLAGQPVTGNSGGPSCLIAYGAKAWARLVGAGIAGKLVTLHD